MEEGAGFGGGIDGEGVDDEFHDEGFGGVDGGEEKGDEEDDGDAAAIGRGEVEGALEAFAVEFNFSSRVRHCVPFRGPIAWIGCGNLLCGLRKFNRGGEVSAER